MYLSIAYSIDEWSVAVFRSGLRLKGSRNPFFRWRLALSLIFQLLSLIPPQPGGGFFRVIRPFINQPSIHCIDRLFSVCDGTQILRKLRRATQDDFQPENNRFIKYVLTWSNICSDGHLVSDTNFS